jgi:tetratricopeptide (TPR) repeat protein
MRHASLALATVLAATSFAGAASAYVIVRGGLAGLCYQQARDDDRSLDAIDNCSGALASGLSTRDRAATLINRGIIHMNRDAPERALADFDTAIQLQPMLAEGHINRGAALLAQDNYEGAITAINRGLALEPVDPARAYYNRGVANEELGQLRAAYDDYRRAADLAPTWAPPRTELTRFRVG